MMSNVYDEHFRSVGLRKMPDAEELCEVLEAILHACELTRRQELICRAIAE